MLYYVPSVNYPQPMQKYLFILLFLIFSCDEPVIEGCTTSTDCNYNIEADKDNGSCIAPQGCNEWCEGDTTAIQELDICVVCNGDGTSCYGCTDVTACNFDSTATIFNNSCWYTNIGCACSDGEGAIADNCGTCDADSSNDCVQDCNDELGGDAQFSCGICWGGNTGNDEPNSFISNNGNSNCEDVNFWFDLIDLNKLQTSDIGVPPGGSTYGSNSFGNVFPNIFELGKKSIRLLFIFSNVI